MYRLVVSDLDETFLDEDHRIPRANIRALERMHRAGVLFVPSSGRGYASIVANFDGVDPTLLQDSYVISYNGGFINRFGDPTPLTSCGLEAACANTLYAEGRRRNLCVHVYLADGRVFVCDAPAAEHAYLASLSYVEFFDGNEHASLDFLANEQLVKIIYMSENFDALHIVGDELAEMADELSLDRTYSSGRYLEFMPKGVNKGTGLARLAEMLDIPLAEVVAVGDSANDHEMLAMAGLGVGVANVTDDVRPACDVVLGTSGTEGAFGELFDRFVAPGLPG